MNLSAEAWILSPQNKSQSLTPGARSTHLRAITNLRRFSVEVQTKLWANTITSKQSCGRAHVPALWLLEITARSVIARVCVLWKLNYDVFNFFFWWLACTCFYALERFWSVDCIFALWTLIFNVNNALQKQWLW